MPNRCVAGGCSSFPDVVNNIALHKFPDESCPAEKKRRKLWVNFVRTKRAKWSPTASSRLCSKHFVADDYDNVFVDLPGTSFSKKMTLKDRAIPTVHAVSQAVGQQQESKDDDGQSTSARQHRRDIRELLKDGNKDPSTTTSSTVTTADQDVADDPSYLEPAHFDPTPDTVKLYRDYSSQTSECLGCKTLSSHNRQLKNKIIDLEKKLKENFEKENHGQNQTTNPGIKEHQESGCEEEEMGEEMIFEEEPTLSELSSPEYQMFSDTGTDTDTETETEDEDEKPGKIEVPNNSENLRHQSKFIVFLSKLLLLFNICPACKFDNPTVETWVQGTMVKVTTKCFNSHCPKPQNTWQSQPNMTGTKMPAMNFLLCFSILVSGASPSKVLQVFKNMGLSCFSLQTYFKHQAKKLFPAIHLFWKKSQEEMLQKLKGGQSLVIAGDGRHDSMGHSAKYCAYTIFCCSIPLIIDFSIVQRNEAGSSPAMEMLAFTNCMDSLLTCGLALETLITDRHSSIAKYMRENLAHIKHYFDLWHLKKKIHKVLTKISKEKDCETLSAWIKPCGNHLMWSAMSTPSGDGDLIWAKFRSYLSHVVNKHSDLPDPIFNECAHGQNITQRRWLQEDTTVYDKLKAALTNKSLINGIKKASPISQTSCLEGFHSVINQYAPKMTAYSFQGMYCRHILAATHFNHNLHRDVKTNEDGTEQVKVVYPKFKNGEATVRNVRVKPKYDYIDKIYDMFIDGAQRKLLPTAIQELNAMTPEPMNTMLDKQPREEATEAWQKRKDMVVQAVPRTALLNEPSTSEEHTRRVPPTCRICKHPMKGHKNVKECPKNKKTD